MKPLLLTIDLQNDFLSHPDLMPEAGSVVESAARLVEEFRARGLPIVHVYTTVEKSVDNRMPHWKQQGLWKCVQGTQGHLPPSALRPVDDEPVIHKTHFSAFSSNQLAPVLEREGCDMLVLVGVHLHGCVRQTAIEAYERGYAVRVAEDAAASYQPLHAEMSRSYMDGRVAQFVTTGTILSELDATNGDKPGREDTIVHRSPRAPDTLLWHVPVTSSEEMEETVLRARMAHVDWRRVEVAERAAVLRTLSRAVREERDRLAAQIVDEVGKPLRLALAELDATEQMIDATLGRFETGAWTWPHEVYRRVPIGVVGLLTPWNNPVYIPLAKIVPALLLGNGVVWKPSPKANQTATLLVRMLRECGLPDGLLGAVSGGGQIGRRLMRNQLVGAVSFTGSSHAGFAAQAACGARRVPLQAELGGNNPALVWKDADLSLAADCVARGAFEYAGQRCTATRRAVVHEAVVDQFSSMVIERANELVLGDPRQEGALIGPLITAEKKEWVEGVLERADRRGNRIIRTNNESYSEAAAQSGCYTRPAVVLCSDPDDEIVQEETFAPVLTIQPANNWKHAVELCNGVRQGLVAALFTRDAQLFGPFLEDIEAGIVKLNRATSGADVDVPFGGWKASGLGIPEHGEFDLDFYTKIQAVYRQE